MRSLALLLLLPALGGCLDFLDELNRPDYSVQRTVLVEGNDEWNTNNVFQVVIVETVPLEVEIVVRGLDGQSTRRAAGVTGIGEDPVELVIPDGRWSVTYTVDGHKWETLSPVRIDSTAPAILDLDVRGEAVSGAYNIGQGADVEAGASIEVRNAVTGKLLSTALPYRITGLRDGVHAFLVVATDDAGNRATHTVQVLAGDAAELPEGEFDAGIVARYTNELRIWDITDPGAYLSRAAAQSANVGGGYVGADYLDEGYGVTPDHPEVVEAVQDTVTPGMNTAEAALALYEWMFDAVDYDEARLEVEGLLQPGETLEAGGGVCRDLAALYVSLLRAAGVPSRLVTGYLAGTVNGFHAWVEFYGGSVGGQDAWIPVDVSPVDGLYSADDNDDDRPDGKDVVLQAFAIQVPEYLELRTLEPEDEVEGWATALSIRYDFQGQAPEVEFEKKLTTVFAREEYFCMNLDNLDRGLAQGGKCDATRFTHKSNSEMVWSIERVLDYGVDVIEWNGGQVVHATIIYPDPEIDLPDRVEWLPYATGDAGSEPDAATGSYEVMLHP